MGLSRARTDTMRRVRGARTMDPGDVVKNSQILDNFLHDAITGRSRETLYESKRISCSRMAKFFSSGGCNT